MSDEILHQAVAHLAGSGGGDEQALLGELLLSPSRVPAAAPKADEGPGRTIA
ncbi:hypothetical protein D3C86_2265100 [compost metagenome]